MPLNDVENKRGSLARVALLASPSLAALTCFVDLVVPYTAKFGVYVLSAFFFLGLGNIAYCVLRLLFAKDRAISGAALVIAVLANVCAVLLGGAMFRG